MTTYFPKPANPVMGVWALREAQALRRAGCELTVLSPTSWVPRLPFLPARARAWSECPRAIELEGVPVEYPRWPLWQVGRLAAWAAKDPRPQLSLALRAGRRALLARLRALRPEVIYAHHSTTCGWVAAGLSEELGIPLVVSEHDFPGLWSCSSRPGVRAIYERVVARASRIVAVSKAMEALWLSNFPAARTAVVYNGADVVPPSSAPRPERLRGRLVVFCSAVLEQRKAIDDLIAAFAPLARARPELLLRIAGDGPDRAKLERQIAALGVGAQVELMGSVPHAQVLEGLDQADLFALLSRREAFGVAYLEAMSAGLPMLWSTAAGAAECLSDGVNGFAVRPGDVGAATRAMEALLAEPARRAGMGRQNRALLERELTWDAHARKLLELFGAASAARRTPAVERDRPG